MALELSKPEFPEFLEGDEEMPVTPPGMGGENDVSLPEVLQPSEERLPIKVIGGGTLHDLITQAGSRASLDFLVKIVPDSFLGDHLLIGYLQLSMYLDFRKLGKTYKTEDPELFKQWLSMKEFGGKGSIKK